MCACFYPGYILSDISDNGRIASTIRRHTSQEYQRFLPPIREQELCERVRQRAPASLFTTDFWRGITYC